MNTKKIFLFITLGAVILLSLADINFYPQLSQGDHGRDLYAAQEILRGKLPFKDFWWVYGPLMPYYFAVFYKLAGGTIVSFLLGKLFLKIICSLFFYLAASTVMAPFIACLGALWFAESQQDFFFTFNHIGGIALELIILYLLFRYIKDRYLKGIWIALGLSFIYCLVKVNFGLTSLLTILVTVGLCDFVYKTPLSQNKKKFYLTALIGIPVVVGFIYWLLLKDLPSYAIHQCMPYFGDDQPYHRSLLETIPYYFTQHWLTLTHAIGGVKNAFAAHLHAPAFIIMLNRIGTALNLAQHLLLHAATLGVILLIAFKKISKEEMKQLCLVLFCLGVFFVLNFHEFIVSGVWYRTFWSLPFLFMFHYIMMATAFRFLPAIARGFIWGIIITLIIFNGVIGFFTTQSQKIPPHFLNSPHAQIYVGNEPQWTDTVNAVSGYLKDNLKDDELFFALPYDDIYYYLLDKESPTRQLIFFDHIHIPREQEISIINELESKNVKYVLLSNRMAASETGLGVFGKTYCPLLASYIQAKYAPVARQGGDWQSEPGWGNNHGVMIFKKK